MSIIRSGILHAAFLLLVFFCHAQAQKSIISGTITDESSHEKIPYANVIVTSSSDSSVLYGSITDEEGNFRITDINPGNYEVKFSFIGYQSIIMRDMLLPHGVLDLGTIALTLHTENLPDVSVIGSKTPVSFRIDKKVIDAGSFPGANTAIDLLENIPSFRLDFEGKLSYRGESSFKVFINGRPVANGEDRLRQLPAGHIDRIELITNPSAKYDAEGTAGIINVIMKKNRLEGIAMEINTRATTLEEYGAFFSIDHKEKKYGWHIRGNYSYDVHNQTDLSEIIEIHTDNSYFENILQTTGRKTSRRNYIEMGGNVVLSAKDELEFSGYINPFKNRNRNTLLGSIAEREQIISGTFSENLIGYSSNKTLTYQYIGATLSYLRQSGKNNDHRLSGYIDYSGFLSPVEEKHVDVKNYKEYTEKAGYIGTEQNETVIESKIEYSFPLVKDIQVEIGSETDIENIPKLTSISGIFNANGVITPFAIEPLDQEVNYFQNIHSAYMILRRDWDKTGLQLGMRTEHTIRESDLKLYDVREGTRDVSARHTFTDYFPSAHMSYSFSESHQLALSYSKRIQRPDYWSLIPLKQYDSPYGYYTGNGNLLPAYTHAYEFGYRKSRGRDFIAFELFTRKTKQIIQNYFSTDSINLVIFTPENVGMSFSTGAELMTAADISPWWHINLSASTFHYKIDTKIREIEKSDKQIRADCILNNTFNLPAKFIIKWAVHYNSPMIFSQGRQSGYYYTDISLNKKIFKHWEVTVIAKDALATTEFDVFTSGDNHVINQHHKLKPYFSAKISYLINNQE